LTNDNVFVCCVVLLLLRVNEPNNESQPKKKESIREGNQIERENSAELPRVFNK